LGASKPRGLKRIAKFVSYLCLRDIDRNLVNCNYRIWMCIERIDV
jgi:hypothetical protein